jgi:hypothetical protein
VGPWRCQNTQTWRATGRLAANVEGHAPSWPYRARKPDVTTCRAWGRGGDRARRSILRAGPAVMRVGLAPKCLLYTQVAQQPGPPGVAPYYGQGLPCRVLAWHQMPLVNPGCNSNLGYPVWPTKCLLCTQVGKQPGPPSRVLGWRQHASCKPRLASNLGHPRGWPIKCLL